MKDAGDCELLIAKPETRKKKHGTKNMKPEV